MEPTALPSTADLARAMEILDVPGDPVAIMKDHPDARRRAELLAHLAAAVAGYVDTAEAELCVDERADLHWTADRAVAAPVAGRAADQRLLDLQRARLAWVQHVVARGRGARPNLFSDTVATAVGALGQLLAAERVGEPDPLLADAMLALRGAADHLAGVLRARRTPPGQRLAGSSTQSPHMPAPLSR